ncbi:hypothetical protein CBR_g60004 [Chara braunii]|uniref:Uncharacterized protein n=1 Tax=Chara braunii TaxID=69332 RepID=A0A388K8T6_CHABU|nr:hypothetical protein CBR_g60004 [Chara braunii]|eukprot:GBG66353.1 hypothetical protein CBR_g60004 [Chara braunii]
MGEPTPDTEEECMAREAKEDEEEAARAKALADADPRTQAMARDMEAMRQLKTGGGVRGHVVEDDQMQGSVGNAHAQTLEYRGLVEEAAALTLHAVREREGETPGPDIDNAPIVPIPPDGEADAVAVAHDREVCGEIVVDSNVPKADAAQSVAAQMYQGETWRMRRQLGVQRRSTTATRKRQPGLGRRRSSTSSTREVHAAGFEHRGGLGADVEVVGGRGSAAPGARVSTHRLREVSQILGADVLGPPRTQRPIPRRASHLEGETTGGEGLEMMRGRRRTDTLLAALQREMRRDGVTVVDDDQTDVAAKEADGEEDMSIQEARRTSLERGERWTTSPTTRAGHR